MATAQSQTDQWLLERDMGHAGAEFTGALPHVAPQPVWRGPLRLQRDHFCIFTPMEDPRREGVQKQRKIVDYDFARVCHWGGIFGMFARASALRGQTGSVLLSYLLFAITLIAIRFDEEREHRHQDLRFGIVDSLAQRLNVMVTFVLGFFVSLCVSRWWEQRTCITKLHGAVLDAIMLASSVALAQEHLRELARLGLLAQALLFEETRSQFHRSAGGDGSSRAREERFPRTSHEADMGALAAVMRLGLTDSQETQHLLGKQDKALVVWCWMARYTEALRANGQLEVDGPNRAQLKACFLQGRAAVSEITTLLTTKLPFTYVQLVAMLVQLNNIIVPICCACTAAVAMEAGQWGNFVAQVVQVLIITLAFQSLLAVCVCINNPFDSDTLDFSFLQLHVTLADQCEAFLLETPAHIGSAVPLHRTQGRCFRTSSELQQSQPRARGSSAEAAGEVAVPAAGVKGKGRSESDFATVQSTCTTTLEGQ